MNFGMLPCTGKTLFDEELLLMAEMGNGILQYQVQDSLNSGLVPLLTHHFIIQLVYQHDEVLVLGIDL
jgi:hypothetical protein